MIPQLPDLEPAEKIEFFTEDIAFQLNNPDDIAQWIIQVIAHEQQSLAQLSFIFCSDEYLHKINLEHLNHDTYTDIITFPYSDKNIAGDIFISIDRIRENAEKFAVSFEDEFCRVVIHGVLHLCGYGDKTVEEKKAMRAKEDSCLAIRQQSFLS